MDGLYARDHECGVVEERVELARSGGVDADAAAPRGASTLPGAPEKSAQHAEMHEGVGPASGATTGVVAESLRCEGAEPGKMLGGKRQVEASRNASSARCAGRLAAAVRRTVGRVARAALPSLPRRVALIGLAFACSLTTLSPAASAQTTLVSNTGQSPLNTDQITRVGFVLPDPQSARAQQFSTGSNPAGYTLSSVSFHISDWSSGDSVAVKIYSDSNGSPGSEVYALSNPITVSDGLNTFTAPADSTLAAQTDYFVRISAPAGSFGGSSTLSGNEDSERAAGWSIGNTSLNSSDNGANWSRTSPVVRTSISGTVNNNPHTGLPTISGTASVGEILTASKGTIADVDGLSKADNGDAGYAYRYQWVRVDADGTSNPTDVGAATSRTYTLAAADVGKRVKVKVSFTDDGGNDEEVSSDAYPARALADTTPPTLGATNGGVTTYGSVIGKDIHLYFSEPIDRDPDSLPAARPRERTVDAFFIKVDGVSFIVRPVSVRGGAAPNELVLGDLTSPIVRGQRVRVGYLDPTYGVDDAAAIQDLAGNDVQTFDFTAIDNGVENTTGPRPIMKFVLASGAGNSVEARWGLYPTSHGADSYDVQYAKRPGLPVPDSEWIDGPQGVSGTPGGHATAGEGTATIENLDYATVYWIRVRGTNSHGAGEWYGPVRAWTPLAWPRRPTLVRALVRVSYNGAVLKLPFYRDLDRTPGRIPSKDLFTVTADNAPVGVGDVLFNARAPRIVYLSGLSPAIRQGQSVRVSYRDPTPGDGTAVLQGLNGADVHGFSNAGVDNLSALDASDPGVGPAPESARVHSDGGSVIVSFDEDVDGNSIPGADAFTVTVGGAEATVSGLVVGDGANELRVQVSDTVRRDETVKVGYARPASGNVIQDADGNAAESFTDYPVDSTQAPQNAPPAPLTAELRSLPSVHSGEAFTFGLRFSEEFPVSAATLRGSAFTVTNGSVTAVAQAEDGRNQDWQITVTPVSSRDAVTIALTPKASCETQGAICTADGRNISQAVEAEVPAREPTRVVVATVTSDPGENGTWDAGETVEAQVRFSRVVNVVGAPGGGPLLAIVLDGTRREAAYTGGNGTDIVSFSHTVTAADGGAFTARIVPNGVSLNGYILADSEGSYAETGFATGPWVTEVTLAPDGSGDRQWTAGESIEVSVAFSEAVTVADGTPGIGVSTGGTAGTLDYASGSESATLVFSKAVTETDGTVSRIAVTANSLSLDGARIVGQASGLAAQLAHPGTEPTEAGAAQALTAQFNEVPTQHGNEVFSFELAFSETLESGFSYKTLAGSSDDASVLSVTNGSVTGARRVNPSGDDRNKVWAITVEPDDSGDVTIALPAGPACGETGAMCTAKGGRLAAAVSATVPTTAPTQSGTPPEPFRVEFRSAPDEHDGSTAFHFEVKFNKNPVSYSYATLRDRTLKIRQGGQSLTATRVARLLQGESRNKKWRVTVTPVSNEDLTVSVGPEESCSVTGAVCAADDEPLSNTASKTIEGPPGLSVADARVDEGRDVTLDFAVTLARASKATVTVDYATSDATATAGADYTATSGALTFTPGETAKTVSVPVLDDSHDEGEETLTLTLSNPQGGNAWLADATATGTIVNSGAMPRAWLARFGRTVASQVIDAVEGRFSASRAPGVAVSVAGQALSGASAEEVAALEERDAEKRLGALSSWLEGETEEAAGPAGSRALTERDLLTGTSFALTGGTAQRGYASVWGRGAVSGFDGREGELVLDGEVRSAMLGADFSRERGTVGLMLGHSRGAGGYRSPSAEGEVESTLTGLYPYGRYDVSERLTVWGVAGYGEGTLTLTPEGQRPLEADMALAMAAVGGRGVAVEAPTEGGVELAVKSDAMAVRTSSEKVEGLEAATAGVTRLRLGLEAAWRGLGTGGGATLVPAAEIGVRRDGGDAETGFGVDVGGGVTWSDPRRGLSAELRARGLLTHEAGGLRERGLAGSLAFDPRPDSERGFSLTLSQTVGAQASGGMDALLGHRHLEGLGANDDGDGLGTRRLELKMGYGFGVFGDRFTATPQMGLGLSDSHRELSLGWRLGLARSGPVSMALGLEATRREAANDDGAQAPAHALMMRARVRW